MTLALSNAALQMLHAWGENTRARSYVHRPTTAAGLQAVFALAQRTGLSIALRGAGQSYGDAALNSEQIVVCLAQMNRITHWSPANGVVELEPGVTLAQLWRHCIGDGWWPPVVSGTMFTSVGGCAAMNIHGKNNWQAGNFAQHILEFTAVLPAGNIVRCSNTENSDLFHAIPGSFGMLGCITALRLQLKRIHTGLVSVSALAAPNLRTMLQLLDEHKSSSDYVVGWIDAAAGGAGLGRGQVHAATYYAPPFAAAHAQSLQLQHQDLPARIFGVFPAHYAWLGLRLANNAPTLRLVNALKYLSARLQHGRTYLQSLAAFNFLLDYVPDWKRAYRPGGLVQHQSFIAKENALAAYQQLLQACQDAHLLPTLAVIKRHKPDSQYAVSYCPDGYSLALDFSAHARTRHRLATLLAQLDQIVVASQGKFYFAKDSALHPAAARASLGAAALRHLMALKQRCDPENLLQSNLSRRLLPELHAPE